MRLAFDRDTFVLHSSSQVFGNARLPETTDMSITWPAQSQSASLEFLGFDWVCLGESEKMAVGFEYP